MDAEQINSKDKYSLKFENTEPIRIAFNDSSLGNFFDQKTDTIDQAFIRLFGDDEQTGTDTLTTIQRETLIGLMLGDGHLAPSMVKHNRDKPERFKLVLLQSDAHKEYLFHLYEIFKPLTRTPPRYYEFYDSRSPGKVYKRWSFSTVLQTSFRFYGLQFYRYDPLNNKYCRVVPNNICRLLEARSIAYWYMDDGAAKWHGKSLGLRFCTDSFSHSEVKTLIDCLTSKFDLNCSTQKKDNNLRIYIKQQSYFKIKALIFSFLLPSMVYKFPMEYEIKKKDSRSAIRD